MRLHKFHINTKKEEVVTEKIKNNKNNGVKKIFICKIYIAIYKTQKNVYKKYTKNN